VALGAAAGCSSTAVKPAAVPGSQTQTSRPAQPYVSATSQPRSTSETPPATPVTLIAASSAYGQILETGSGTVIYYFSRDSTSASQCRGTCAKQWRPLMLTARPHLAAGVSAALIGHIVRPGGSLQLSYAGHPLYTYSRDNAAGQINGQAVYSFGGTWLVVLAVGNASKQPGPTPTASNGGTGI
jgi:predicted lipoprotein with Yx(FWY)xxD motif